MGHNTCKSMGPVLCVVRRHTLPIFSNPKILNIYNIYNHRVLIFMQQQ